MTHELKGENVGGRGCAGQRGIKGVKWDNCNSIINKVYLKIRYLEIISKIYIRKRKKIVLSNQGPNQDKRKLF